MFDFFQSVIIIMKCSFAGKIKIVTKQLMSRNNSITTRFPGQFFDLFHVSNQLAKTASAGIGNLCYVCQKYWLVLEPSNWFLNVAQFLRLQLPTRFNKTSSIQMLIWATLNDPSLRFLNAIKTIHRAIRTNGIKSMPNLWKFPSNLFSLPRHLVEVRFKV